MAIGPFEPSLPENPGRPRHQG